jgi:hypothetical protein
LWSGSAFSAGTPIVNPGTDPAAYHLGAVRFREFTSGGNEELYLGVPDLDLGGLHRTQMNITWSSANQFAISYDSALDKLITSVDNGSSNWTLEYPNFSNNVRDLVFIGNQAAADYAMSNLDYLQIGVTLREKSPADISLDNVQLDGIPLGNFPGKFRGTEYWHVDDYDFSNGFTLTGTLNLSGVSSPSPDLNDVDISFGSTSVNAPIVYNVLATPNPVYPETEITLTATVEDPGTANIQSSEYNVESGVWSPMSAQDGNYDSPTEDVTATFNAPVTHGEYHICVRGTNTDNNTGPEQCTLLSADNQGPQTTYINASPNPVTSAGEVTLSAIVDDTLTGVSDIESADYSLAGDSWKPMIPQDGSFDSPTENVIADFTILNPPGEYDVCVRGVDVLSNVGSTTCTRLTVSSAPSESLNVFFPIINKKVEFTSQ